MKHRPSKCFEGCHFNYKHDGFFIIEMIPLKVVALKFCGRENQIVFRENCLFQFCFLGEKCNRTKVMCFNFFRVSVNLV